MITRRDWFKAGMLGAAGLAIGRGGRRADASVLPPAPSPTTRPFIHEMRPPDVKQALSSLDNLDGDPVNPAAHQEYDEYVPQKVYEMRAREGNHRHHPDLRDTNIWGYDGLVPGPTLVARYHEPVMLRVHNDLPANHIGFGIPEISTHLHNAHTASESDGFPADFYGVGRYRDHHYCGKTAGEDPREALGSLWYHDHRFDFTAQNVYRGLAGVCMMYDDVDTGNENDTSSIALRLPSGAFDVPLLIQDKRFDANSQLAFDVFNMDGLLGDKVCVNGQIQPFFKVKPRKYRFRLVNGSLARFYELFLTNGAGRTRAAFTYIASDGNLLPAKVLRTSVRFGPAERYDVVVDFKPFKGQSLYLENRLAQTDGRKPASLVPVGTSVLRFDVDTDDSRPDPSRVPTYLRPSPEVNFGEVTAERTWTFARRNSAWTINDRIFNVNEVRAKIPRGSAEIWTLVNPSGGWAHPIHIHFEEFQILSRNGFPAPAWEGRKDVVVLNPNETVKIFMRFRDFKGKYVMHCHNLTHEDHAMMLRYDIV